MTTEREQQARTRKAMALVETIKHAGIPAAKLPDFNDGHWNMLARATFPNDKKYVPSATTRAMVIELMRGGGR